MTRRPRRALATLSALWFAILVVAGPLVHVCAMHDGMPRGSADAGAGHAMHGDGHEQAPVDDDCEHCTCVGECAVAGMAPALASRHRTPAAVVDRTVVVARGAPGPSTGSPATRLPFSVGPPLLA